MTAIPHNMPRGRRGIQSAFADIRADYDATRQSRFVRRRTGVAPQGSGSDYHFRNEGAYYALAEQARDMDRNDSLVGILADRRVDNIVQGGFTLDPNTGDKKLNTDLWQWWDDFSNDPDQCDIAGECTWKEIERQACRSESIDGDIVVTGTEDGSFQMIESHLIRTKTTTPDTFLGVTTDSNGKRHQYHVAEETGVFGQFGDSTPIEVRDSSGVRQVFHVYNPKRVNVTRGVTQLAPVFSISGMLEDINFAKLVQQQVVSCFAILRETAAGTSAIPSVEGGYGDDSTETTSSGTRQLEGVSPGMQVDGGPGVTLKGFSPNVPNSEYFQQVKLILQIMGVNFGLPLCLVLMDGSETNFSGWRGAVDEARKGFVADQLNLVRRLNKPAYNWKLRQYIESGSAGSAMRAAARKLGDAFYRHNWNLPTWSYIEPVADSEGDASQIRNTQTSPRRQRASRGMDWETIVEESVEDNAYAISAASKQADKINAQFPDSPKLTWRDLISLPMPVGQTLALQDPAAITAQESAAAAGPDGTPQPTGEMAGLSTLQFTRNKKAIKKMLTELASGAETEAATRAYLGSIGLTPETIDVLVKDAIDGKVDTPELNDDGSPQAKTKDDPRAAFCPTGPGGGTDNSCGTGEGGSGGGKTRTTAKPMSQKAARAKAAHVMVDKEVQRVADKYEQAFAKSVNGISFKNSEPVDVVLHGADGSSISHGVEHKYMFANTNSKITMNKYAQIRKLEWEKQNKAPFHTVVETKEGDVYYRRGVGSFRVHGMHKVTGGTAEIKKLMSTKDSALPSGAHRTDAINRQGSWKPLKIGKGYMNTKTGEIVKPKTKKKKVE